MPSKHFGRLRCGPDAGADRCRRLCRRSRLCRSHRSPPPDRRGKVGRRARSARSRRRANLDVPAPRRHTRRPRWRVGWSEARPHLRTGTRGRRLDVQDVGQGLTSPHRPWPDASLHRFDPEDQPARHHHAGVGADEDQPDGQATAARHAVDGQARRGVGLSIRRVVARTLRGPHADRGGDVRNGRARSDDR